MPNKTTENEEKNKKKNVAKNNAVAKKSSTNKGKKRTNSKNTSSKKATNKSVKTNVSSKKKNGTKKVTKKVENKKIETKKVETKEVKKVEPKKEAIKKDEIKEKTVIEKIKAFIAKIVAMQEEARLEAENEKAEKKENSGAKKSEKKVETISTPYMLEYYDLPYRYNETVVKILAQTPKRLFVYWDISDNDRQKYLLAFGERFFEETYPVLLVHNEDMDYTFEVPINDFANSWYLDINDAKSKYTIQLGRKFREKPEMVNIMASTGTESVVLHNDYVPIITSNILEVPNDHILFENLQSKVLYRNVKTGTDSYVEFDNLEFSKRMGKIYSIYDVYKEIYKNEIDSETLSDLLNPSSMSSSKMSSNVFI